MIWKRDFGAYETEHGNGFSPIVYGAHVFVTHDHESDSALYALNRKTGKTIWKVDRTGSKPSASTPTIYQTKQGKPWSSPLHNRMDATPWILKVAKFHGKQARAVLINEVSPPLTFPADIFASCGSGGRGSRFLIVKPPTALTGKAEIKHTITRNAPYVPQAWLLKTLSFQFRMEELPVR